MVYANSRRVTKKRPPSDAERTAGSRKGAAKSQRRRWEEKNLDVYTIRFVHADPGQPASVELDRFKDSSGRRVERVTVRIADADRLAVNGHTFPFGAAFEALATERCGTGKLGEKIIPHASTTYANKVIRAQLCRAGAEHVWKKAQKKMGQGPGDGSHKPQRRRPSRG